MIRWFGKDKKKPAPAASPVPVRTPAPVAESVAIPYHLNAAVEAVFSGDTAVAHMSDLYNAWRGFDLSVSQLRAMVESKKWQPDALLCVAALNGNGHVREVAITLMAGRRCPYQLPFILWALRDWVPQVREAAQQTLETCFVDSMASAWLEQYTLLKRVAMAERVDLTPMLDRIAAFLLTQPDALSKASDSPKALQRRFAYQLRLKADPSDESIFEAAINDIEPANRAWLAQQLGSLEPLLATKWTRRLLEDPSPQVLQYVLREMPAEMAVAQRDRLEALLLSSNWNIRHAAKFVMGDWSRDALAAFYRNVLTEIQTGDRNQADLVGCLGGLGDTGSASDFELLAIHANAHSAKVRAEAVRAIGQLDRQQASPFLIQAIQDSNTYVRRIAGMFLNSDRELHETDQLFEIVAVSANPDCVRSIQRVIGKRGWWTIASFALLTAASPYDAVSETAWGFGAHYYNRSSSMGWLTPDANERIKLEQALRFHFKIGRTPPVKYQHRWSSMISWVTKVLA